MCQSVGKGDPFPVHEVSLNGKATYLVNMAENSGLENQTFLFSIFTRGHMFYHQQTLFSSPNTDKLPRRFILPSQEGQACSALLAVHNGLRLGRVHGFESSTDVHSANTWTFVNVLGSVPSKKWIL